VSVKKVNILSVELDEALDEAGFRHLATSVGLRLGAQRIGASVYQAESSAVGYWHGEGTGQPSEPVEIVREPETSPPQPAVNARTLSAESADPDALEGSRHRTGTLGPLLAADRLDGTVLELESGEEGAPYHYVHGREAWLLVLSGTPSMRHPHGEDRLETGDLVCLPEGPAGAHGLLNRGESAARALLLSTTGLPANVYYPDSGHWLIRNGLGRDEVVVCATVPSGPR
jgi:uncharacterized cupin superfamily protein